VIELIGNTTEPMLLIATVCAALVVFRVTLPKASVVGQTANADLTPVPDNNTVLVPAPPPPVTLTLAVFVPVVVGLNFTQIVQRASDRSSTGNVPGALLYPLLRCCQECPGQSGTR